MKASELIQVLADGIARHGDQCVRLGLPGRCSPVVSAMESRSGVTIYAEECDDAEAYRDRIAELETDNEELRRQLHRCDTIPAPAPEEPCAAE